MKKNFTYILLFTLILLFSQSCNNQAPEKKKGIEIDLETRFQTIEGFGSCIVNYKDFPDEYNDPDFFDRVVNDLGLSIVRVPLMEHTEWINDDDDPNHFNWDGFWLNNNLGRKGTETSMQLLQKFKSRGVERFMGTPWSPPEFMKTTRAPIQGGYLRADMLEEYAEYISAQIILAKKNYGIDLNWVSIQNELLFIEFYRSCIYNPFLLKETVRALMQKFEKEGIKTRLMLPEDMMFVNRMLYYIDPTMKDPVTKTFNGNFCTHRHGGKEQLKTWVKETSDYGRQTWMTETSGHQQTWEGALKMASDIQDYLVYGNNSAWIYWQLSEGEKAGMYSILVDGKPTPKYYASKQFYRYIRPGAIRIKADTENENLHISAFHHPSEGTITAVLINTSENDVNTSVSFDHSFKMYRSSETEECTDLGRLHPGDEIAVPAKSIVTLVEKHRSLKTLRKMPELPASWEIPENSGQGKWGNEKPFPRKTSFQISADGGNVSAIHSLKKNITGELLSRRMHNGWSHLHLSLMNGDGDAVKYLLENGADVNAKANDGWTPLHMAASAFVDNSHKEGREHEYSRHDLLTMVMDAGADLSAVTKDGFTALHAACANAYTGWRGNPEHSLQRIRDLIDAGIDMEARDIHGRTALHWAAMQGYFQYTGLPEVHANVVKILIKAGANIHAKDDLGYTPLHHAVKMGYSEIVLALVEAGANPELKANNGESSLDCAKKAENEGLIYIMLNGKAATVNNPIQSGESVKSKSNNYQYGPELLKAAWEGNIEDVKKLLEKGADITYRDTDGFDALQRALDNGHTEIVDLIKMKKERLKESE